MNAREEILRYLDKYGVRDKDAAAPSPKAKRPAVLDKRRAHRGRRTVDLHGLTVDAARRVLREELDKCANTGIRELLVIHGYGRHSKPGEGGSLKTAVRSFLEEASDAGKIRTFVTALPKDGGDGATTVQIRG